MPLRASYDADGFTVAGTVPDTLRRNLHAAIDAIAAAAPHLPAVSRALLTFERDLPDRKRGGVPAATAGDAIFLIGDPFHFAPIFAVAFAHEAVVEPVRTVLGTSDIVHHFGNVTTKSARCGSGISWHRDAANTYMPTESGRFVRAMICLDGMDAGNGGTSFRPGTHRDPAPDQVAEVVPVCPPGAVVLIHPRVLHGGPPNHSDRRRRNIVVQWGRRDDPLRGDNRETLTGLSPEEMRTRG